MSFHVGALPFGLTESKRGSTHGVCKGGTVQRVAVGAEMLDLRSDAGVSVGKARPLTATVGGTETAVIVLLALHLPAVAEPSGLDDRLGERDIASDILDIAFPDEIRRELLDRDGQARGAGG